MCKKNVVECEQLDYTPKPHSHVYVQNWSFVYVIVERVFKDMCKLELASEIKVHPTIYVLLLKLFRLSTLWLDCK